MLFRKAILQNWCACNFFAIWVRIFFIFLIDLDIQLILEFKSSFGKNCPFFPKNQKTFFSRVLFWTSSFAKIKGLVTFLLHDLESYFFLNDADIKLILEFKDSFGKFCPVFPKNPKNWSVKIIGFWLKI